MAASTQERGPGELAAGSVLGGYRIDGVAGRGGMGVVYRATQMSLGRTVALKVIDPLLAGDPAFRKRFEDESALAASLDHPNVVTIHEAGEDGGRLFVSMRLVPGTDLGKLLVGEGPLDAPRAVGLIAGVASALDAAHARGLVHRDVKPSNVLVERRADGEHAYLSDFGVVKRIGTDAQRTGSAGWVGTADFVAPEQVTGGAVDARSDVYALGGVLYMALTARVPFERSDIAAKLYASVNEPVPSVRRVRPELPAALDEVIARATAKDPGARYPSAGEFAGAAQAALTTAKLASAAPIGDGSPPTRPSRGSDGTRGRRRPYGAWVAAAGLVLAAAIAVVVIATTSGGGGQHPRQRGVAQRTPTRAGASARAGTRGTSAAAKGLATADDYAYWGSGGNIEHLRVTIYDVRRSGPFVILDFGVVCVKPASGDSGCTTQFDFDTSAAYGGNAQDRAYYRSGGIDLVDTAASREYRPVYDSVGNPDTSVLPFQLSPGSRPLLAWAKFAAPPASVTSLDVVFPNGGPQISSIPISTGAAHTPSGLQAAQPAPGASPADSTSTAGLTLPVVNLQATAGNPNGSDVESPGHSTITLRSDVLFHFNKSDLTPAARTILASVANTIKARATGTVTVTGYTDSIGTDNVNIPLSRRRAASVVAALDPKLSGRHVSFSAAGLGSADPVAHNTNLDGSDNPAGRALNRRVTISFAAKAPAPPAPPPTTGAAQQQAAPATSRTASFSVHLSGVGTSQYQVTVGQLVRERAAAVLRLTVTCLGTTPPTGDGCNSHYDLAGSPTIPPYASKNPLAPAVIRAAGGFYLIDPATGTEYIPFYDRDGVPLASALTDNLPVGTGSPSTGTNYPVWVYFPAPPRNVTSVTVALGAHTMRVTGVPVR